MRLHVEAEFTRDSIGRLLTVNDAGRGPAPRFFFGSTPNGNEWWFRDDVDAALTEDLRRVCKSQSAGLDVIDPEPFIALLSRTESVHKTWTGPAYHFPADLPDVDADVVRVTPENVDVLRPYLEDWLGDVSPHVPMVAALVGGQAVSVCASVRITPNADEAGVDTHRDFRRRGYGARVVAEWAKALREINRIPLYSTSWDNTASRALAKSLGLIQFGSDLHIT